MGASNSLADFKENLDENNARQYQEKKRNRSVDSSQKLSSEIISQSQQKRRKTTIKANDKYKLNINHVYLKSKHSLPLNKFFTKFFNIDIPIKKKEIIVDDALKVEEDLNTSDLNFSDLDCLKLGTYEEEFSLKKQSLSSFKTDSSENLLESLGSRYSTILNQKQIKNNTNNVLYNSNITIEKRPLSFCIAEKVHEIGLINSYENNEELLAGHSESETNLSQSKSITPKSQTEFNFNNFINSAVFKKDLERKNYYTKLAISGNLPSERMSPLKKNCFFIFDWDDTLFCTSYLTPYGIFRETQTFREKEIKFLIEVQKIIIEILDYCIKYGNIYIVTNAIKGWVELSIQKFYPKLVKYLSKIKIISARSEFEAKYPKNNREWKIRTFLNISKYFDRNCLTNIICIGDSTIEIEASSKFKEKFENAFLKTIKFRESPKPEELIKELKLINSKLQEIYSANSSLTINIDRKNK
jgi:hypothetical protein